LPLLVEAQQAQEARVELDGQTLFVLQTGLGSITPLERARVVNTHLEQIAESSPWTTQARVEQSDVGWVITVSSA
jgi:hypothetical protein